MSKKELVALSGTPYYLPAKQYRDMMDTYHKAHPKNTGEIRFTVAVSKPITKITMYADKSQHIYMVAHKHLTESK